jgi:PAS domain S-box-containing protein
MKEAGMDEPINAINALVRDLPGIALSLDADARIRYASPGVVAILGFAPDELTGRLLDDLVHPADRARVSGAVSAPLRARHPTMVACRVQRADGSWRQMDLHFCAGEQYPLTGLAVAHDTGGPQAEGGAPPASRIAHDLNNHLSTILGFTELLLADLPEDDPYREDLVEIHKAGKSALAITGRLAELLKPRDDS